MNVNRIRKYTDNDKSEVYDLYKRVAEIDGRIARTRNKITDEYINNMISSSGKNGIHLVVDHPTSENQLVGEIHCYKLGPSVFNHVLSELTMVVSEDFQGKGIGKLLLKILLSTIETKRNDILRVELIARESNTKAIELYQQLGFKIEGKLENRIDSRNGTFEADIPMAWINKNFRS